MKVLKKGRAQKGWAGKFKCTGSGNGGGGCGAELLVEIGDCYETSRHSIGDAYPETFVTFACPDCDVETDIPDSRQPPYELVQDLKPRRRRREGTSVR